MLICDTNLSCCKLRCSMFIFFSLRTWIVQLSLARSSIVIPSYNWYYISWGRAAKLSPRYFIMLSDDRSITLENSSTPYGNTIVFAILACNICSVAEVPAVTCVDRVPPWGGCTCNSCIYTLRAPNTIWCSCMNSLSTSLVTSRTVSLMSWRSPSVKVIGSMASFKALNFFLGPDLFAMRDHFNFVDVALRSTLPYVVFISFSSYPEDVAWTLSAYVVAASTACVVAAAFVVFFYSANFCAALCPTLTSATTFSFHLFSANWVTHSLALSIFFWLSPSLVLLGLERAIWKAMSPRH